MNDAPERPVWFLGDLDDPWVASIADALPREVRRLSCAGDLTPEMLEAVSPPRVLILHRNHLTPGDADRLARFRTEVSPSPRVVLCVGPHVRHAQLERWGKLVDVVVPEATARDTIARHLAVGSEVREPETGKSRPTVRVVSRNFELGQTLADSCEALGYPAEASRDWTEASPGGVALWDVPVLEADWPDLLARRARTGPVVALLGFADRARIVEARAGGASACLELPCDLLDLGYVLDHLALRRAEPAHELPPPPAARRHRDRRLAGPGRDAYNDRMNS